MLLQRKKIKKAGRAKIEPIKKKRQREAEEEIIDYAGRKEEMGTTDA